MDAVRVGDKWFGCVLGAGFDSRVNDRANRMSWPRGRMRYNLAMVAELRVFKPLPFRIVARRRRALGDRSDAGRGRQREVLRRGHAGLPGRRRSTDGLIDMTVIGPVSKPRVPQDLPQGLQGHPRHHPAVTMRRAEGRHARVRRGSRRTPMASSCPTCRSPASACRERCGSWPDGAAAAGSLETMASPAERYAAARRRSARIRRWRSSPPATEFTLDDFQVAPARRSRTGTACWSRHRPEPARRWSASSRSTWRLRARRQVLLHDADQGAVEPEVPRPDRAVRRRPGRAAHRRQRDQRRRRRRRDDDRGAPQHALRRLAGAARAVLTSSWTRCTTSPTGSAARSGKRSSCTCPRRSQLVSLSATVSNAEEFGEWLQTVRGDTTVIVEEHRPVPLWQSVLVGNQLHDLFVASPRSCAASSRRSTRTSTRLAAEESRFARTHGDRRPAARRPRGPRSRIDAPRRSEVVERLDAAGLLPAIVFIFSRAGCDAARPAVPAGRAAADRTRASATDPRRSSSGASPLIPDEDLAVLGYAELLDGLRARRRRAPRRACCRCSRRSSRSCSRPGSCKVVFATETLALGHQHAGPQRRAGVARQVERRGARRPHAGGVHPAHRPGRPARHRRRGARRRAVDRRARPATRRRPGLDPHLSAALELPAVVQHGGQPGHRRSAEPRRESCWSRRSRSSRPTARWSAWPGRCGATTRRSRATPSR